MAWRTIYILIFLCTSLQASVRVPLTSFNAGEVSPYLLLRSDYTKYSNACKTLQNMLPLSQGPVVRRPGTYYIADAKDPNEVVRLIPFEYSKTDAYIMEFGNNIIRFYRSVDGVGGQILDDDDAIYELATVFEEEELFDIQYVQLADCMYLVNGTDPPQKLSRYGHSHWTIADVNYVDGPFLDEYLAADSIIGDSEDYASDEFPSTARELATVQGTASGAVAYTNDNDDATYRRRIGSGTGQATAEFTIEIPFTTADNINQVVYKIGWWNPGADNIIRTLSCQIHYDTADEWVEISTDQDNYVEMGGDWDDVNGVKIHLYNWSFEFGTAYAGATLYELQAWGLQASDTKSINYIKSSNTQTYDRTLDAAAAADQGGTPNIVRIPSTAHGFLANDYVTLSGTTNYDGTHKITNINDADTFDIASAFTAETFATTDTAISRVLVYTMEDTFAPGHIGALWEIRHARTDATSSGTLDANESFPVNGIDCEGDYKLTTHGTWTATVALEKSNDSGTNWETVPGSLISSVNDDNIIYSGTEDEPGYKYRVTMSDFTSGSATYNFLVYDHMHTGVVKITDYIDANNVTAEIITELGGTGKTTYHSEGYWSDKNGWPQTIEFHEFRLWFGGSRTYPQTLWASKTDDYEKMSDGTDDDDALIYLLPSQNPMQWMLSHDYLLLGTIGGVGKFGDPDEEMTPSTKPQYRQQTRYGCAPIKAFLAGDAILYVERMGKKIREFSYNYERDRFLAPDLTILAEHITGDGIVDIAFQERPDPTIWCVREDGKFISMTYNREQNVVGWSLHITDGEVDSIAVIPGEDEDEVWLAVARTVNSLPVRYIEQMQPRDWGSNQDDVFFVDSGLSWDGGDSVNITTVTQADPGVVTVASWPTDGDGTDLADDDQIKILSVVGMTELNGNIYTIDDADSTAKTFSLNNSANSADVDTSGYTAYSSGGTVQRFENSFTGYNHLEGKTLAVCVDGVDDPNVTVSTGAFTTTWTNRMHAGLAYTSRLETMPISFPSQEGAVVARVKQIGGVVINFYETLGTKYGVSDDLEDIDFDQTTLFSDWIPLSFQHGSTREATVYLQQTKALPLTLRAMVISVDVYD